MPSVQTVHILTTMSDFTHTIRAINIVDRITDWIENFTDPAYLATQPAWLAALLEDLKPLLGKSQLEIRDSFHNKDVRTDRLDKQDQRIQDLRTNLEQTRKDLLETHKELKDSLFRIHELDKRNEPGSKQKAINDKVGAELKHVTKRLSASEATLIWASALQLGLRK